MTLLEKTELAQKQLDEMCANTQPPQFISVGATVWMEDAKRFMCGLWDVEEKKDDYVQYSYGASINEAITNYYNKYWNV